VAFGAPELAVNLGTAGNFTILAQSGISTTGPTSITDDIGVSPIAASAITGFGLIMDGSGEFSTSPQVTGRVYAADYANPTPAMLTTAVGDMQTAYIDAAGRTNPDSTEMGSGNIGGLIIPPGLHKWSSGVTIPNDVTLSGDSNAVWIFQIAGTLNISSGKQVLLSGGARARNIFWQVAGQTTLGTTSVFHGIILDQTGIVAQTGATLSGRALAQTAVSLDSNLFTGVPPEVAPTILCPANVSVNTDPGLCAASNVPLGTPTSTGVGVVLTNDGPTIFPRGITVVTWTATDGIGLTATCQQTVTVTDAQPPQIMCPPGIDRPADPGQQFAAVVMLGTPTVTDNCPGATFSGLRSDAQALSASYPVGTTTVTWTATDTTGNTASCAQLVTVTAPTILCPPTVLVNTDAGVCTASGVLLGTPSTTGTGVVVSNNAPTLFPRGTTLVTWTATDVNGATATCQQMVIVTDIQVPAIACPPAINRPADPGQQSAAGVVLGTPTVTDNCPSATFSGVRSDALALSASYPVGTTTVTWTATDSSGNTASCPQLVTVTAPTILCPPTMLANTSIGVCTASGVLLGTPTTTGTGVVVTNNAPTLFPRGTTLVTWTATDVNGATATCQQMVIVTDIELPVITCPAGITAPVDPGQQTAAGLLVGTATAADNCPAVTVAGVRSDALALTAPYPVGVTTITWTATDVSGNTASCPQTITVTASTISCPPNVNAVTDTGICTASGVQLGVPVATGTGIVLSNNAPTIFPLGVTVVTWTATDSNNATATCQQTVTVRDAEVPVITCAPDVLVHADAGQQTAAGVVLGTPVVTDNCPGTSFTGTRSDALSLTAPYPVGTTTITWTGTDAAGNTASCPQQVVVTPNPTITCPANVTANTDAALCTASGVALGTPTTTGLGVVVSNDAPSVYPLGATVITWTATDGSGATATCQQTVTVRDAQAPTITCGPDVSVPTDAGQQTASGVMLGTPTAADNCPGVTFAGSRSDGQPLTAPYPTGTTTITWTATDGAGNMTSCPQLVVVAVPLTIACPPNVSASTDAGKCTASGVLLGTPLTTGVGVVLTNNAPSTYPVGTTVVIWTATGAGGATVSCQQQVAVSDGEAPRVTCPANIVRKTLLKGPIKLKYPNPKALDNCGVVSLTCTPPSGGRFKVGKTRVTCTATDAAGNSASCTFTITVLRCR
jgi:hypothetical protein